MVNLVKSERIKRKKKERAGMQARATTSQNFVNWLEGWDHRAAKLLKSRDHATERYKFRPNGEKKFSAAPTGEVVEGWLSVY